MEVTKFRVIEWLKLLSDMREQDDYHFNVPQVEVAIELINGWFDDYFMPEFDWFREAFTDSEWRILTEFHRYFKERVDELPECYPELRSNSDWQDIIKKANWALKKLGWDQIDISSIEIEYFDSTDKHN